MLECVILGDSIAVGLSRPMPECVAYAKSGINTWQFNKQYGGEVFSDYVIISLGSNDHKYVKTQEELEKLRRRILATQKVIWILPSGNLKAGGVDIQTVRQTIIDIATKNGDRVIGLASDHVSADGIHPTGRGYQFLTDTIRKK